MDISMVMQKKIYKIVVVNLFIIETKTADHLILLETFDENNLLHSISFEIYQLNEPCFTVMPTMHENHLSHY